MSWQEIYESRQMPVEEAIKLVKSGDRVVLGHAVGIPTYITDAMVDHKEDYTDVEMVRLVPMGNCRFCEPGTGTLPS